MIMRFITLACIALLPPACAATASFPSTLSAIIVHGYHLESPRWEEIVWGDVTTQRLGRLPQAALLAWEQRDELAAFICGTGASRTADGTLLEAEATIALLFEKLPTLLEFDCFHGVDLDRLEELLRRTVVADTASTNTESECRFALDLLTRRGDVQRATFVSSPTHMPRCLRDACAAAQAVGYQGTLLACPCATTWSTHLPVVLEPPHRPEPVATSDDDGVTTTETTRPPPPPAFYDVVRRASTIALASSRARAGDELLDKHSLSYLHTIRVELKQHFARRLDELVTSFELEHDDAIFREQVLHSIAQERCAPSKPLWKPPFHRQKKRNGKM